MPMYGNWRRNVRITGKKSLVKGQYRVQRLSNNTHPKRLRKPNVSKITPKNGHLMNTSRIPPRKQSVPLNLFFRAKK